ncbi:hypothetical protein NP493_812g01004 [Ridgeia piscesae]|uniref:Uncharacterized protein n=1 Tax=Ridgeia piscesae TaxID=27915 RepID=A0AAD9KP64_RIDPI|nr:hypothetical protein NP493_812g01004 [Ridgeia piscesae]
MEGAAFDYKQIKACNSNIAKEDTCRYHVSIDYTYNRLDCQCPLPCEETGYMYQSSSSVWPSDAHKEATKRELTSQISRFLGNATDDELWNNLLKLKVYFEEFNYENIEETPVYSTINFASDIGGILGLWIGCSIISLFEFLELSMDFVMVAVMRVTCRRRGRDGDKSAGTRLVKPTLNSSLQLRDSHVDKVSTSSRLLFSCFANISTAH